MAVTGPLAAAFDRCEAARAELLAILDAMDPRRWDRRPGGGWTVSEQVDHLILSEIGTSKMARRLIRGDFAALTRPDAIYDSTLAAYPYPQLPAPDGLVPAGRALVGARDDLDAVHRRFREELARFEGPDADALAAPDPATGVWFTLGGWVQLQALHERHHVRQIRAALE
jgi:hypothetical protein